MSDGKIYITISDKRSRDTAPESPVKTTTTDKKQDNNSWLAHKAMNFLEGQVKQFINYSIGNIGNFTGDYRTQQNISQCVSLGKQLGSIGLTGLLLGPEVMGIALAGTIINTGYQTFSSYVSNQKQNREIEHLRELSGLSGLTNGSR